MERVLLIVGIYANFMQKKVPPKRDFTCGNCWIRTSDPLLVRHNLLYLLNISKLLEYTVYICPKVDY